MAKSYAEIMKNLGKIRPEESLKQLNEMLTEKGMTFSQFLNTEEGKEARRMADEQRFTSPDPFLKK